MTDAALKRELPDRVYGLRETKIFRNVLSSPTHVPNVRLVEETVTTSPFRNVGEPLLFPFLILEAKSEKGVDSWSSIEEQTALPIRSLLKVQQDLGQLSYGADPSRQNALVWFLSYKGEEWRVHGCLIDNRIEDPPRYVRL